MGVGEKDGVRRSGWGLKGVHRGVEGMGVWVGDWV